MRALRLLCLARLRFEIEIEIDIEIGVRSAANMQQTCTHMSPKKGVLVYPQALVTHRTTRIMQPDDVVLLLVSFSFVLS